LMAYKMTAERDTETVKSERASLIIAVAKARVFASEGWQVTITTDDGKVFAPDAFDTTAGGLSLDAGSTAPAPVTIPALRCAAKRRCNAPRHQAYARCSSS
jgi:hypothetical protein